MKIIFKELAYRKMRAYVNNMDYEISGLGKIEKQDDVLLITDIRIFEQVVTGGSTIIDPRSLARFYNEVLQEENDLSGWKLWWHSHVDFQAFFSGTDTATIEDFDSEMKEENWMLSIVTNHEAKLLSRVDIFEPIRCTISDLAWDIEFSEDEIVMPDILAEIKEKIHKQIPAYYPKFPLVGQRGKNWIDFMNKPKQETTSSSTEMEFEIDFENAVDGVVIPLPKGPMKN